MGSTSRSAVPGKGDISPGQIYSVPAGTVALPARPGPQPLRKERWLLVVSNKSDCRDPTRDTVLVVILSSQTQYQGRSDELIKKGDGGTVADCIAQTDLIIWFYKHELRNGNLRGEVQADTSNRVKARMRNTLGL